MRPALQTLFGVNYQTDRAVFQCTSRYAKKGKQGYKVGQEYRPVYSAQDKKTYNTGLLESTFALVPHGDGRWNYRFSEVIGAGSIPVVLSDGLTLPFAQIIDWSKAAIVLPEKVIDDLNKNGGGVDGLLSLLPSKVETRAMLAEVQRIHSTYFATPAKREAALMASAYVEAFCRRAGANSSRYACG